MLILNTRTVKDPWDTNSQNIFQFPDTKRERLANVPQSATDHWQPQELQDIQQANENKD